MTKKAIFVLIILLVLAVAAGYFFQAQPKTLVPDISGDSGIVTWQPPVKVADLKLTTGKTDFDGVVGVDYYQVGVVASGKYAGDKVIYANVSYDGPVGPSYYHFILDKERAVILKNHSIDGNPFDPAKSAVDADLILSDLIYPANFSYNGSNFTLEERYHNEPLFDQAGLKLVFTDPKLGPVYTDAVFTTDARPRNGFYVKAPDGTIRTYSLAFNFYDAKKNLPAVTWSDGSANQTEYVSTDLGGCGTKNLASVNTTLKSADLVPAGQTSFGEPVYVLSDSNNAIMKMVYDGYYPGYDEATGQSKPKLPYADFVALRPIFFWSDSFGRLIKFQRSDILPVAECGKPVIYLYPETTSQVSVQVAPKGGFSKTEPDYGAGWQVIATPDSQITDLVSGKTYPYLFWEGRGGLYETPQKGFVVAAADVHNFLVEKLSQLGLNAKERADFLEFWEPRLTGAPYFFVTFLGNQQMNQLAPLTISPQPDTIIRILMDFLPLAQPIEVEGFNIQTPVRQGFTVVEWGGVLR